MFRETPADNSRQAQEVPARRMKPVKSETHKKKPKHRVFGLDIPRTSGRISGRTFGECQCRFSKCRFSAELEKLEKIFEMGGSVEK